MPEPIPFIRELDFAYGKPKALSPLIRRVIAHNPSPFTFHGTGTYIVGRGEVAVIDPGPAIPEHVAAILAALEGEKVSHILITHTHSDHSPASALLKAATGAPTHGFGPHPPGRSGVRVEEDGDHAFVPDVILREGDVVAGRGFHLEALHTPGHISNHLCFSLAEEKALFSGDHVMGWSTTVVSPPDGNMRDYMAALRRLLPREEKRYYPTHGAPIEEPAGFVARLIAHREEREAQILLALKEGARTIPDLVAIIYRDVPRHLHPAAARSVLAHLIHMHDSGRVATAGTPDEAAVYEVPARA